MSRLLLSQQEADRFATWLELEADVGREMLEQYEKLPANIGMFLIEREKREITAALIIARKLRTTEHVVVGPGEVGKT